MHAPQPVNAEVPSLTRPPQHQPPCNTSQTHIALANSSQHSPRGHPCAVEPTYFPCLIPELCLVALVVLVDVRRVPNLQHLTDPGFRSPLPLPRAHELSHDARVLGVRARKHRDGELWSAWLAPPYMTHALS
eukprot:587700-Rhodomonas_salina.2